MSKVLSKVVFGGGGHGGGSGGTLSAGIIAASLDASGRLNATRRRPDCVPGGGGDAGGGGGGLSQAGINIYAGIGPGAITSSPDESRRVMNRKTRKSRWGTSEKNVLARHE